MAQIIGTLFIVRGANQTDVLIPEIGERVQRGRHLTETYLPKINGVANTLQRLAEGLRRRGHRVHLIRPGPKGERAAKNHSDRTEPEKINHGPPDPLLHPDQLPAEAAEPVTRETDGGCRNSLSPAGRWVGERGSKGEIGAFCDTLPDGERHETLVPSLPIPSYPGLRFGLPVYRCLRRMWRETPPDASLYRHPRATRSRGPQSRLHQRHSHIDRVVPEAMASGLAMIAVDYGAASIHIRNWENGVTVPMGDTAAFREAAGNAARLRGMGEGAQSTQSTATGMRWEGVIGDLEERLVEVIDCHRKEHRHETLATAPE